jgi:acyl-CoA thioesterase II
LQGLDHQHAPIPDFPKWSELPTIQERFEAQGEPYTPFYPFWDNLEQRPPQWRTDWMERESGVEPPYWHEWLRFRPTPTFADPWVDACRLLILVDLGSWPAVQASFNQSDVIAPSIDLACHFHEVDPTADWLFVEGHAPRSGEGLITSHQRVWSDTGRFLASGVSQLLCRPVPPG